MNPCKYTTGQDLFFLVTTGASKYPDVVRLLFSLLLVQTRPYTIKESTKTPGLRITQGNIIILNSNGKG